MRKEQYTSARVDRAFSKTEASERGTNVSKTLRSTGGKSCNGTRPEALGWAVGVRWSCTAHCGTGSLTGRKGKNPHKPLTHWLEKTPKNPKCFCSPAPSPIADTHMYSLPTVPRSNRQLLNLILLTEKCIHTLLSWARHPRCMQSIRRRSRF